MGKKNRWQSQDTTLDLKLPLTAYAPGDLILLSQIAAHIPSIVLDWIAEDKVGEEMKVFLVSAIVNSERMSLPQLQKRMRELNLI